MDIEEQNEALDRLLDKKPDAEVKDLGVLFSAIEKVKNNPDIPLESKPNAVARVWFTFWHHLRMNA